MKKRNLTITKTLLGLFIIMSGILPAAAVEITVTTNEDHVPGSLRYAVTTANTNQTDTTIILPPGTYLLKKYYNEENDNYNGDLDINTNFKITIQGSNTKTTIIDGNQSDRVLHIINGTVSISNVTIQNGKSETGNEFDPHHGQNGGGIYNKGTLDMTNCDIIDNETGKGGSSTGQGDVPGNGGNGGGIYNKGTLTLYNCNVKKNITGIGGCYVFYDIYKQLGSGGNGGGIYNDGTQTITNCNIDENETGRSGPGGSDGDFGGNGGDGGGICNTGTQNIKNCRIRDNQTGYADYTDHGGQWGGRGGGIFSNNGKSTVSQCDISNNTTGFAWTGNGGNGGGIYNSSLFTLKNSKVENNITGFGDHDGYGGGIFNEGSFTMKNSTVTNNVTGDADYTKLGHGGGVFNGSTFTAENCTISGNRVGRAISEPNQKGDGGGIYNDDSATSNLTSCTIYNNSVGYRHNEIFSWTGYGGGIYNTQGTVNFKNTIIAGNRANAPENGYDCFGVLASQGYNLIQDADYVTIRGHRDTNLTGIDPMLETLSDNGGNSATHALKENSPAIDAGFNFELSTDQRGMTRPIDFAGIPNQHNGTDIGAYEYQGEIVPVTYDIRGQAKYNRNGMQGVTLTFSNNAGQTVTDGEGNFSHPVPENWYGKLSAAKEDYTFSPAEIDYDPVTSHHNNQDFTASPLVPTQLELDRKRINFGVTSDGIQTPAQLLKITNSGGGILNWNIAYNAAWLNCDQDSGSGAADVTISINPDGLSPGNYYHTITVSCPDDPNLVQTVTLSLTDYPANEKILPFGSFDTPLQGASISAGIPITGWAIDNIGIQVIKIYRSQIGQTQTAASQTTYIGDAVMIEGTRPDIQLLHPHMPDNYKAGWGYMLLTNTLPNLGNGSFTIYVEVTDLEGNSVILGERSVTCDNKNAVKPFGALDTPAPGGTVSGQDFVVFGWALTPLNNTIPKDGSTIFVWLDHKPIGNPVYNRNRLDIAGLFPGYNNSNGAGGYFILDTTKYENGLHTIAWSVTDSAGNSSGIGSRYFIINNRQPAYRVRQPADR